MPKSPLIRGELCQQPIRQHIDDHKSSYIGGEYSVGDVAFHLGYAQHKEDTDAKAATWQDAEDRMVADKAGRIRLWCWTERR